MIALTPAALLQKETIDPHVFLRENRIHVQGGSLFLNPNLVLHRRELDPANEPVLRKKLAHVFTLTQPSYFDGRPQQAMGINLGQLVPVSLAATHSKLTEEIAAYNARANTGHDKSIEQPIADRQHPIEAAIRETLNQPKHDPVGWETLRNGMALTLMIQEKMRQQGFSNDLKNYFTHVNTPDQVLGDAQRYTGVSPLQFREAAKQGVDAVGALLGLDGPTIGSIKAVVEESQKHEFTGNVIKNYQYGREKLPATAPLAEILATGLQAKIDEKIPKYRAMVHEFESPAPIQKEEAAIAEALKLVHPVQLESLHLQGYEICYTPNATSNPIAFFSSPIYGLHRRASDNPRALLGGSPKIYFAGGNGLEKAHGTLVHEIAHNVFPDRFTNQQVAAMEQLITAGDAHISKLHHFLTDTAKEAGLTPLEQQRKLCEAYCAGTDEEKAAVTVEANKLLTPVGITFESLLPYLQKPESLERLTTSVARAHMDLRIEGDRYLRSGYDDPSSRVREMISRFAELKQVVLRDAPDMLNFIAPQMNELFDNYYIPHLREVNAAIRQQQGAPAAALPTATTLPPRATTLAIAADAQRAPVTSPPPLPTESPAEPAQISSRGPATPVTIVPPPATPPIPEQPKAPVAPVVPPPVAVAASTAGHSANCAGCAACTGRSDESPLLTVSPQGAAAVKALEEMGVSAAI